MKLYVDRFIAHMNKNDVPPPREGFIEKGQLQIYCENEVSCWYILDTEKPAIGLYGRCDCGDYHKWAPRRGDDQAKAIYKKKFKKMMEQMNVAFADVQISNINIAPETIDLTDVGLTDELSENDEDSDITRLATMSRIGYDRVRKDEASRLNIRVSTLDIVVAKQRKFINKVKHLGPQLLTDIYHIFLGIDEDRIRSEELSNSLCVRNKLWATYNQGENINFKQISDILKLYGIQSKEIRFGDKTYKGYKREFFAEAFSRYVIPKIRLE